MAFFGSSDKVVHFFFGNNLLRGNVDFVANCSLCLDRLSLKTIDVVFSLVQSVIVSQMPWLPMDIKIKD